MIRRDRSARVPPGPGFRAEAGQRDPRADVEQSAELVGRAADHRRHREQVGVLGAVKGPGTRGTRSVRGGAPSPIAESRSSRPQQLPDRAHLHHPGRPNFKSGLPSRPKLADVSLVFRWWNRRQETRPDRGILHSYWSVGLFSGADDGIRTRDPHLGKVPGPASGTCGDVLICAVRRAFWFSWNPVSSRRYPVIDGTPTGPPRCGKRRRSPRVDHSSSSSSSRQRTQPSTVSSSMVARDLAEGFAVTNNNSSVDVVDEHRVSN